MNLLISIISTSFFILLLNISSSNAQPENVLIQTYLDGLKSKRYNPKIPPQGNGGHGSPVHVFANMYLIDVHKVDDFSMDYRASFYFRQFWNDTRLAYPDLDISTIILNDPEFIWTPDLFFLQEKEGIRHDLISPNVFLRISSDGEVRYSTRLSMTFSCPMDFRKYPHDIQKCLFSVESYGNSRDKLLLDWRTDDYEPVMKTDEINVLPFELIDITPSTKDVSLKFGEYRALEITLTFKRKLGFYITRLYVPFIILVALSWLSFWIKSKMATLRLSLLLVIMYLMVNIGADISSYIPPSPYTKASDLWIAVCESLVFAAFLEFILVSILVKSEEKRQKKRSVCSSDPEAPMIEDSEAKNKSETNDKMGSAMRIVASRLSRNCEVSTCVDKMASILFPVLFIVFNFLYWLVY